jgi:hypothetical protein
MVTHLLEQARLKNAETIILEVIKHNIPAQNLFTKLGFQTIRELLVLRRPPGLPQLIPPAAKIKTLGYIEALHLLENRTSQPSWLDEYESLVNAGNLAAFHATLADGSQGWLVYQNTVFQLGRLVIQTDVGNPIEVGRALLHHLHTAHSAQDTKTENLPADDPHWPAFKEIGYLQTFERVEMAFSLK